MPFRLSLRQRLGIMVRAFASDLQVVAAVAAAVASVTMGAFWIGSSTTGSHTDGADAALTQAYQGASSGKIHPAAFPNRAALEQRIAQQAPQLTLLRGTAKADYAALRRSGGGTGTVYIKSIGPDTVALVARRHRDAIRELDVTVPASGPAQLQHRTDYAGRYDWALLWWFLGVELFLIAGISLLSSIALGRSRIARLRRWQSLVSDSRLGPQRPELDHVVYLPHCEDWEDGTHFTVKKMIWGNGAGAGRQQWEESRNFRDYHYGDLGLEKAVVPHGDGVAAAGGKWFEFCAQVAAVNAGNWRAEQEQRTRQAEAQRLLKERQRLEQEETALADVKQPQVAAILPPALDLMTQALDTQPLALDD